MLIRNLHRLARHRSCPQTYLWGLRWTGGVLQQCCASPLSAQQRLFSKGSNAPSEKHEHYKPPQPKFYVPKADRTARRTAFDMDYMVGETRLARNSRTCPTRELNFMHQQWGRHKSPYRRFRHMANIFYSAPFQRIVFPELASIAAIAGCLTYYNEYIVTCSAGIVSIGMPPTVFAGATTAIGLLAGFRLNSSYARVKEGRKAWSDVNAATRDLTRQVLMWMNTAGGNNTNEKGLTTSQIRMLRLCQAYPVALMFYTSDKGCHHNMKRKSNPGEAPFDERVLAEFKAELYDVYRPDTELSSDPSVSDALQLDFERFCRVKEQKGSVPLDILACMTDILALHGVSGREENLSPIYIREMDVHIQRLGSALGSCERIVKTPLPTGFTRHSSRLLFMWSNSLPFALYPLLGPVATMPTALLTAYAVLGVEDISIQLEEPFDILPLREYSDSIIGSINALESSHKQHKLR